MLTKSLVGLLLASGSTTLIGQPPPNVPGMHHPATEPRPARDDLNELTRQVAVRLPRAVQPPDNPVPRNNYIDDFIFGKMYRDQVPHAHLSADEEFIRRASLDLIGRLPAPDQVLACLRDPDTHNRAKFSDELTEAKADGHFRRHPSYPFLDRWTYFFM